MHTQTELGIDKKMIKTSDIKSIEKNSSPHHVQQEKLKDSLNEKVVEKNDRKKKTYYDGRDNQNTSPRRTHRYPNRQNSNQNSNYQNVNRNNRSNPHQFVNNSKKLDTNNNKHQQQQQQPQQSQQQQPQIQGNYTGNGYNNNNKVLTPKMIQNDYHHQENSVNGHAIKKQQHIPQHQQNHQHQIQKQQRNNLKNIHQNGSSPNPNQTNYTSKLLRADEAPKSNPIVSSVGGSGDYLKVCNDPNMNSNQQQQNITGANHHLSCGDNESLNRKYSMDFLHQVGHQYKVTTANNGLMANPSPKNQKAIDDTNIMALKMALGDNSGYYNHFYSGAMYGNQVFLQQQQQHHHIQNYARYQQQLQQQRIRMIHRQENYQRVYQQNTHRAYSEADSLHNRHHHHVQQPQQPQPLHQNQIDQRLYHNSYYHPPQNTMNTYPKRGHQREQYRKHRHQNNNNNISSNNNNHSTNDRSNYKKSNDQGQRLMQTKSENNIQQHDDYNKRKSSMYIRTNSEEYQYRSLSPTPPSSVKSASPGIQDKSSDKELVSSINGFTEYGDDSESTASSAPSALSYSSEPIKELPLTPTLLTLSDPNVKESHVNSWINNNNFAIIHNAGLSASAEQLNLRPLDASIQVIKRPPSVNGIATTSSNHHNHLHSHHNHHHQSISRNYFPAYDPSYPFDYYFARSDQSEMRIEPANLRCGSSWDIVSQQIWDKFQVFQQTRETYRNKMILWRDLYEFIRGFPLFQQRACPKWGLFLVGSTISGFGLDKSDIDMCLVLKAAQQLDPRTEAMITLSALKNYLISTGSTFQGYYLINAKVPILRFRDSTNTIEVDLNYNNCIGVRNTHLLYCYAQLDWRLRPLAIAVKLWAQFHNINDARNSTISSYSLVLMVIHFLQSAVSPAVLPCLHQLFPEKFQVLHDITTIDMMEHLETDWQSENRQPIGELFSRFLDYYSNFDYVHSAISIRTGGILSIEECKNVKTPKNDANHWQTLCIEEPFDLTNTARSTYDGEIFEKIKNVFFQSWRRLKESKTLECLFKDPLFVQQNPQPPPSTTPQVLTPTPQVHTTPHIHHAINAQTINDVKYMIYAPSSPINSSPLIPPNNPEVAS